MKRTLGGTLQGRAVELREVSIGVALEANKQGDGFRSALFVLSRSAFWQDTGEPVFLGVNDIIDNWPMIALSEINELATLAGQLNVGTKPDAPPGDEGAAAPLH